MIGEPVVLFTITCLVAVLVFWVINLRHQVARLERRLGITRAWWEETDA